MSRLSARMDALERRAQKVASLGRCWVCGRLHVRSWCAACLAGTVEAEVCRCGPCGCVESLRVLAEAAPAAALSPAHLLRSIHEDVEVWSHATAPGFGLRPYQLSPARAIIESVARGGGDAYAVVFSRQSGKDEMLAQILAYLLWSHRLTGGSIVVAQPTMRPQGAIAKSRLEARLRNILTNSLVTSVGGVLRLGNAACSYVSAAPGANARGATASLLLVCNEAQDVAPDRWDAVYDPMAASTNATTVFMGTVWTARTLLARQMRYLRELEARDGRQRVFLVPWETVARYNPPYGDRVRARIAQLGRNHPFVKTEYYLEELAGEGGLFPVAVQARIRGDHARRLTPEPGRTKERAMTKERAIDYAACIDVGGEERDPRAGDAATKRHDATALTVVEVESSGGGALAGPCGQHRPAPTYRVMDRRVWTGAGTPELLAEILHLARDVWGVRRIIVDATGIGAGLAAFLRRGMQPGSVEEFVFTTASKSELGWAFLSLASEGRFIDHAPDGSVEQGLFWSQLAECRYEVLPGPGKRMRWGVEAPGHDDVLISAALTARLDGLDWRPRTASRHRREALE